MCVFLVFLTHIIPYNARLELNELITGDIVIFDAPRGPYTMEVEKGRICPKLEEMNDIVLLPTCISLGVN